MGESVDASLELGEGSGLDDHLLDGLDLLERQVGSPDRARMLALGVVGAGVGHRQQRRGLALAQIVADRLARAYLVAECPEDVVTHLERVAERQAVGRQCRNELTRSLGRGEQRPEVEGSFDRVLAALVAGDPLGGDDAAFRLGGTEDVEELTHVEFDPQLVPDLQSLTRGAAQELIGIDEREVADEDGHTLTESAGLADPSVLAVQIGVAQMRRALTTTNRRAVHHVVVEQGEGVEQFERRSGVDCCRRRRDRRRHPHSPNGRTPGATACHRPR